MQTLIPQILPLIQIPNRINNFHYFNILQFLHVNYHLVYICSVVVLFLHFLEQINFINLTYKNIHYKKYNKKDKYHNQDKEVI